MTDINPPAAGAMAAGAPYVVNGEIQRQESYVRLLPLVKWLLLIPHWIALTVLGIVAFVVLIVSWFAVIILGRYPRGMWDFMVGVYRWAWRVVAYFNLMTDRYPPFTLAEVPDYPARFKIEYPETVARWRPIVQWILIIPYSIVASVLGYVALILVFIAFWVILFTKRFPEGMFNFTLGCLRWQFRGSAYSAFLVTKYPPFTVTE